MTDPTLTDQLAQAIRAADGNHDLGAAALAEALVAAGWTRKDPSLRVYLAAPYGSRDLIRAYAAEARSLGIAVTSSWLAEIHEINAGTQGAATALSDAQVSQHALDDLADIDSSDVLVLFTAAAVGVEGGGGRHVETGYALARLGAARVIVVGKPENVFHRMLGVTVVADWSAALEVLGSLR